jgi:hypothetical protein
MSEDLIKQLEHTREGYDDEVAWHRFLIDAYTGGGGFQGSIKQPAHDYWGSAATLYATGGTIARQDETRVNSYLDRYPREDSDKYRSRVGASHYTNYVAPLTDLKCGYIRKRPHTIRERPEALQEWHLDTDGNRTPFDRIRRIMEVRAACLGWCPAVVDLPEAAVDDRGAPVPLTQAQARELGRRPKLIPLYPANLVDYECDESGVPVWAKIRTDHAERDGWSGECTKVCRYTIWTRTEFEVYEVRENPNGGGKSATRVSNGTHTFGRVPVTVLRHKEDPDDPIRGLPMHGAVSLEAKALFNRVNELEEHLRSQVFAILLLPLRNTESGGETTLGTGNGLVVDPEAKHLPQYIAPPSSVAETLEKRVEASIREMYRVAGVEYAKPTGGQIQSGVARRWEFEQTNQQVAGYANNLALWEKSVDELVGLGLGLSEDEIAKESIEPAQEFGVQDLEIDIKNVVDTLTLQVGATASQALKLRVIEQQLPNMAPEMRADVEEELAAIEDEAAQAAAMGREIQAAALENPDEEEPVDGDPDPGAEGEEEAAA